MQPLASLTAAVDSPPTPLDHASPRRADPAYVGAILHPTRLRRSHPPGHLERSHWAGVANAAAVLYHCRVPVDPLVRRMSPRAELTQGAVLLGLRLPRYGATGACGAFLLTARCDLAHVRTDTVNALPIVPLRDWLRFDASISALMARLLALRDKVQKQLQAVDGEFYDLLASDLVGGARSFVMTNESVPLGTKNRLSEILDEYGALQSILENHAGSAEALGRARASDERCARALSNLTQSVERLVQHKLLDAHFLPVIRPEEPLHDAPGYVILFRQVIALPGRLVVELHQRGFGELDDVPLDLRAQARDLLTFPAGVVGNIASPHVEHILQRFANVFQRIGVDDHSAAFQAKLQTIATKDLWP